MDSNMKNKKNLFRIFFLLILLLCLYGINRDLFHYEYRLPFSRIFDPGENSKGNYLITDPVPLKKAVYELSISGTSERAGNGCYVMDEKIICSSPWSFPPGR